MEQEIGIIGLINRGNTCYLNTALQCLYNLPNLTSYFDKNDYVEDIKNRLSELKLLKKDLKEIIFTKEYIKLIKAMVVSKNAVEPKSFHEIIQKYNNTFIGYEQQDSHETLSLILDYLHEGLKYDVEIKYKGIIENEIDEIMVESIQNWKKNIQDKHSIITELFFGQFINKIMSLENENKNELVSKTFEMFNMLNIPIYGKTLYDSLSKYFEKEILESKYFDEKNKKNIDAYKQIKLMKIPKYLIIVLKRYKNHTSGNLFKSNNLISFPIIEDLDLTEYSDGYDSIIPCSLKLISIGCHEGSLNGGHYYSVCRNKNGNWYKYDDETVSKYSLNTNKIDLFKYGYILIYEKNE
jgi:ubiquitin C-terminal hydrolase